MRLPWQKRSSITLTDGAMRFVVPRAEKPWDVDCVELKLVAEDIERQLQLRRVQGAIQPSTEFLDRLAKTYSQLSGLTITPTLAHQIWTAVSERFQSIESSFQQSLSKALS